MSLRPAHRVSWLAAAVLLVVGAVAGRVVALPGMGTQIDAKPGEASRVGELPPQLREVDFAQRLGESIPLDATFRDETGATVALGDLLHGRPAVLALVYYECPMLCNMTLNGLTGALEMLDFDAGREFEVLTVSFEPKETPELARAKKENYLRRYNRPTAQAGWHFLTGDAESIRRLTSAVGFKYVWDESAHQYAHAAGIVVVTPQGRIARYFYGVEFPPKDLRLGLVEAADGKIGNLVDRVLLYCFHYDPETGKYGAAVMRLVRAGAILILAAIAGFLIVSLRREKKHIAVVGN